MNTDPDAKIQMLNSSMRCFVFGLLGLIPVIGLPFAHRCAVDFRPGAGQRKTNVECRAVLSDLGRGLRCRRDHFLGVHPIPHHFGKESVNHPGG